MKNITKHLKNYKKQLILGPIAKLLEAIFELTLPLLMSRLIDLGIKESNENYIIKISIIMGAVSIVGLFCAMYCQYSASIASQGFGTSLRNALLEKINTFSHEEIDSFGTTTLTNRLTSDVNQLQLAVAMLIRLVIRAPFLCIGGIIMTMIIDFKLSLVLIIFIPIFILVLIFVTKKTIPIFNKVQKKLDNLSTVLRENLIGVRVIRAFANSDLEKEKFNTENNDWMEVSIKAGRISSLLSPLTLIILNIATLFIIWFGGDRVYTGNLTQGELIAFINYITQIILALIVVSNLAILYNKAFVSLKRIIEIFNVDTNIKNNNFNIKKLLFENDICVEFKNVSFKYNKNTENNLENINFKVKKGSTVGIIGGTGSGKSALINLIPRFYNRNSGEIFIDGEKIENYNLETLREKIGFVPQNANLFSGTILSNLKMGNENITIENINRGLEISQSKEFVNNFPEKYNKKIAQGGVNLSGGQKQRLTIARALVKNPDILILDDSTSALDYLTDLKLRQELKKINLKGIFIVSQRINAIKDSDLIILLDQGKINTIGTHKELFNKNNLYREICKSQNIEEVEIDK